MHHKILIVGIGTDVGKTIASAVVTKALEATYFKPIQCGYNEGTDKGYVQQLTQCDFIKESYLLKLPASPHLAAAAENVIIEIETITEHLNNFNQNNLVIEGAGGIMVPLNNKETFLQAAAIWNLPTIIISRNYLGSINHSLLTAQAIKHAGITKCAWLFNDSFMDYEKDIENLSGIKSIGKLPNCTNINEIWISTQAELLKPKLMHWLNS